ncbi:hypothetical protein PYW07_011424 [Mythimna separata]|uniref:Glucose-1-phosphatase n=1 Tax=Mythimna separata TaxID=271217 RepID=A0AAD7YA15_MYTSE|nr:hypothetical protein PYW07_011424 [Mythimna separata]
MAATFMALLCLVALSKGIDIDSLKLEQVLILSRHNVRTPLTAKLESYSSKLWPKWNASAGYLTEKGTRLEGYMGKYIAEWLDSEDFIEGCPNKDDVLIYANTKPRTLDTAKAFAESAFQSCNITVQHYENIEIFDPLFLPILHNTTEANKNQVREEMENKLKEMNLTDSYIELSRILNLRTSDICKKLYLCELHLRRNEIILEDGEEPNVSGPLDIGNSIVDSFIMSYYEGMPTSEVAWGQIKTDQQWDLISKICKENQNIRFNLTKGAKDIARPLVKYMFDIFKAGTPKFTLLVGHDSNMNSVIRAFDFQPFVLPEQFEPFPIGGKVIFQKWSDVSGQYLKVEYVYPTTKQLRDGERVSLLQPPKKVLLELKGCEISKSGYCPWTEFMKLNEYA